VFTTSNDELSETGKFLGSENLTKKQQAAQDDEVTKDRAILTVSMNVFLYSFLEMDFLHKT
jgi:hypothetical protein